MGKAQRPPLVPLARARWLLALLVLALSPAMASYRPVKAQGTRWTPPQLVHRTDDFVDRSGLVSDGQGRVHWVWEERLGSEVAVYYSRYEDGAWTMPNDVLRESSGESLWPSLDRDRYGRLHLGYSAGPSYWATVADANLAETAQAWSLPELVGDQSPLGGEIALDREGQRIAVFPGRDPRVYLARASTTDLTWSTALPVSADAPPGYVPSTVRLGLDPDDAIHVAWTELPMPGGVPVSNVWATRSMDGGGTWESPILLSERDRELIDLAVGPDGSVHALLTGRAGVGGRYHRYRLRDAAGWSDAIAISEPAMGGGLSGGSLAFDGAGVLHALFGIAVDQEIAHAEWDGQGWTSPQSIGRFEDRRAERMKLTVADGNQLHAVWEVDHDEMWHAVGVSSAAPGERVLPDALPSPTDAQVPERFDEEGAVAAAGTTPEPSPRPAEVSWDDLGREDGDGWTAVVVAFLSAGALVGAALLLRRHG